MATTDKPLELNFDGVVPVLAEDEALFSRNVDGQLVRVERATAGQLDQQVTLEIDGRSITVPRAQPTLDSQGDVIRDGNGEPIPRPTTIFDATSVAFVKDLGDVNPISTLCHREHLPPVGVCRVCLVEATEESARGRRTRLVPSCIQRVSDGMIIHTGASPDEDAAERVRNTSGTVVELLLADHSPHQNRTDQTVEGTSSRPMTISDLDDFDSEDSGDNELLELARSLGITKSRFNTGIQKRGTDSSSSMIAVDHDQCIMCGRCVRGCNWVKHNDVIGRGEKGYESRIVFDLDDAVSESSCVSCGECVISCPTNALTFQDSFIENQVRRVADDLGKEKQDGDIVTADELQFYPIFTEIPYKFLQFNSAAVIRRILSPGDVLCREGEYGSTAFLIMSGELEVFLEAGRGAVRNESANGIGGFFGGVRTFVEKVGGKAFLGDSGGNALDENERLLMTPEDLIVGEMTCLNRYPRSATVVATQTTEVLEIKRNVLFMLQRNKVTREKLQSLYRNRSLKKQLERLDLFGELDSEQREQAVDWLSPRVDLLSVDPGQNIFRQGDLTHDFYIVALGFVKVSQSFGRQERVLDYLGPGHSFGEIGLLERTDLGSVEGNEDPSRGVRTASCSALDNVELIRIPLQDFSDLLQRFPDLRPGLELKAQSLLKRDQSSDRHLKTIETDSYLDQGLYQAQSLLVLDLERCTRCDECTKACSDTHGGVTRLIRDGLRFDKYLVASSCRSCMDPYCLVGCPVDAIHRNGESLEIQIEDYCIGCGLCANNCPYGNINMHGFPKKEINEQGKLKRVFDEINGRKVAKIQQRATTCDLCKSVDGKPSCVYACPHDAAFRMTGSELLERTQHGS